MVVAVRFYRQNGDPPGNRGGLLEVRRRPHGNNNNKTTNNKDQRPSQADVLSLNGHNQALSESLG